MEPVGPFPNLLLLSIEKRRGLGADSLQSRPFGALHPDHCRARQLWPGGKLERLPSEIICDHIYVSPFHKEKIVELARFIVVSLVQSANSTYPIFGF